MAETTEQDKPLDQSTDKSTQDNSASNNAASGKPNGNGKPRKPFYKRPVLMTVLLIIVIGGGIIAIISYIHSLHFENTDDAFIDGHIVPISPRVAANVIAVNIDDNSQVKQGDILIELDQTDFKVARSQAEANTIAMKGKLDEATAMVSVAAANVAEAHAEVSVAQTNFENADQDLKRYLALDARARSQQQLDNATAAQKADAASLAQARAKVTAMQAQLEDARMAVETAAGNLQQAQANVAAAQNNLEYCKLRAPSDGLITRKNVEVGSYVQIGQILFSIVPREVWVTANFKETQLQKMYIGQPVEISVDAYPDRKFRGHVDSIQNGTGSRFSLLPPENATGNYVKVVQRVPVKIVFEPGEATDPGHLLAPGMSVEPEVDVRGK
jgi:membrane fusion protein (multidrug efflux system)